MFACCSSSITRLCYLTSEKINCNLHFVNMLLFTHTCSNHALKTDTNKYVIFTYSRDCCLMSSASRGRQHSSLPYCPEAEHSPNDSFMLLNHCCSGRSIVILKFHVLFSFSSVGKTAKLLSVL